MVHMVEAPTAQVSKWSHASTVQEFLDAHMFSKLTKIPTLHLAWKLLCQQMCMSHGWKPLDFTSLTIYVFVDYKTRGCLPSTNAWKFLTFFTNTCLRVDFNVWKFRMFSDISFKRLMCKWWSATNFIQLSLQLVGRWRWMTSEHQDDTTC